MAFYEFRQYKVRPGKMEAWVKFMEEHIIPFQVAKGTVITGSFRGETDDSIYGHLLAPPAKVKRAHNGQTLAFSRQGHWQH